MAGKTIAPKSAVISAVTATGYVTIPSTTGWYATAKGAITIQATGTLDATAGNFANNETVTIGTKVYTFQTILTNVDGNVFIGASAAASLDNLIDAINLGPGAGVDYAALTTLHPSVTAAAGAGDTMVVTAKTPGTVSIATTDTAANAAWVAATLQGGIPNRTMTVTEVFSATVLGIRLEPDDHVGPAAHGPNYGRSDMSAWNGGTVYQHDQFIFNPNDLPLS